MSSAREGGEYIEAQGLGALARCAIYPGRTWPVRPGPRDPSANTFARGGAATEVGAPGQCAQPLGALARCAQCIFLQILGLAI